MYSRKFYVETFQKKNKIRKIAASHANPGAEKIFAGSSSYILIYIFLQFSNTSANNNISVGTVKSWYSHKGFILNLYKLFLCEHNLHQQYLPYLSDYKNLLFQVTLFH